jgi:hypothetical protein
MVSGVSLLIELELLQQAGLSESEARCSGWNERLAMA